MVISHAEKFIFIHNYKVAGTSIEQALNKYNNSSFLNSGFTDRLFLLIKKYPAIYANQFNGHISAKELKHKLPATIFENYFKFGFVRNPWDWQVSLYTYMLKLESHHQHQFIKKMKSFDEYIEWRIDKDLHLQKDFFYDDKGVCLVNYIGKMENLNNDFTQVCKKIHVNKTVPHLNQSREDNCNYLDFYTDNSIKMVNEAFKVDIELFGYVCPHI